MIDSYKDLNIGKFLEIRNIDLTDKEEIDIQVALISILADMTEDEVLELPIPEYRKMVAKMSFLFTPPDVKEKLPKKVMINGEEYTVVDEVKKMRTGQFIDYESYISKDDSENMLPYILSCILIPKGKTYGNDYDLEATVKDITEHLPIETALSIARFFFRKSQSLIRATLTYLGWMMKKRMRKAKTEAEKVKMMKTVQQTALLSNLVKSGDGLAALIELRKH